MAEWDGTRKIKPKPLWISWSKKQKQWHYVSHSTVTDTIDIENKNWDFVKNGIISESRMIAVCGSNGILNYFGALCYFHGVCWCERLNLNNLLHFNSYQELSSSWGLSVFGVTWKCIVSFVQILGDTEDKWGGSNTHGLTRSPWLLTIIITLT